VGVAYGRVNILTAFLGAILGGLGTEHGIHLLGRYSELRARGDSSAAATREAFTHTGGSALISASVAALTFASLRISEFRAFREFGVIAATGMVLTVLAYIPVLPALWGLATRLGWTPKSERAITGTPSELARWLPRHSKLVTVGLVIVTIALTLNAPNVRFDYDFAALEDATLPSHQLDRDVNRILGYSMSPVVVLTETREDEAAVTRELQQRSRQAGRDSTIDFVASISDLVPPQQAEKHEVMQSLAVSLDKVNPDKLEGAAKEQVVRAKRLARALPFVEGDVPTNVRRQFQGVGSTDTAFVLAFPAISLSDGAAVRRFAKEVRDVTLPNGETLSAAGDAMVLADILDMVTREAPIVLVAAMISVLLAMWLAMGRLKSALECMVPTVVSILVLIGLMPLCDVRFNYLNIVVIPVIIGTTVDAGVHLVSRFKEADGDFRSIFGETGRAIGGGLLTSAVGFADHPGLNSLGKLTNLGYATNLIAMLVGFPALLLLLEARKQEGKTMIGSLSRTLKLAKVGVANYLFKKPMCISFEITHSCNAHCKHCHRGGHIEQPR
jgi:predicted RND superfamily exporter protein